jgi:hypothetical protein
MKEYYAAFEHVGASNSNARRSIALHSKASGIDSVKVYFHLDASSASCSEVRRILGLLDGGDIEPGTAVGLLIAPLEQSLQHLHRLISLYPPRGR